MMLFAAAVPFVVKFAMTAFAMWLKRHLFDLMMTQLMAKLMMMLMRRSMAMIAILDFWALVAECFDEMGKCLMRNYCFPVSVAANSLAPH